MPEPLTDKELQGMLERSLLMQGREVRFEARDEPDSVINWIREALCTYPRVVEELISAREALRWWIRAWGAPPCDPYSYDSHWEKAWRLTAQVIDMKGATDGS